MVNIKAELCSHVMRGEWEKVVEIYEKHPEVRHMKLTYSSDTALHMAVYEARTDIVKRLVSLIAKDIEGPPEENRGCQPSWDKQEKEKYVDKITKDLKNDEGNNPLHVAAKLGNWEICFHIAKQVPCLVRCRNKDKETPFFLAALHGEQKAFLVFYVTYAVTLRLPKKELYEDGRRISDGRTILHCAIDGEYFGLAYQIIRRFPYFVDSFDHRGYTPLHVLATKQSAFSSSCSLTWAQRFIYSYASQQTKDETPKDETRIQIKTEASSSKTDRKSIPPTGIRILIKLVWRKIVNLLQNGHLRMKCLFPKHMVEMRETHLWANKINLEILRDISYYNGYFQSGDKPESGSEGMFRGQEQPDETLPNDQHNQTVRKDASEILLTTVTESQVSLKSSPTNDIKKETPMFVAAKNGIEEIVESILDKFDVAIHDVNSEGKNLMILAVENRQPQIYQLLVKKGKMKIIRDLFLSVDKERNSALHLAAMLKTHQPWRAPDAILQMQWEIKWYKCIKEQMPPHLFGHQNKDGKTAEEIFMETNSELVKNDIKWLMKTSDSCTIVAALIATVAFATSVSVPGGTKSHGEPVLGREPMFEIFSFSSLGTLCFSLTAVLMFLTILTSRHQATDFGWILPTKLLIGLTALFLSIASVLVSFCSGHFFVVRDILKHAKVVEIVVAVIPVSLFAIAQFPLYIKLIWATMKKVPDRGFMATSSGAGGGIARHRQN